MFVIINPKCVVFGLDWTEANIHCLGIVLSGPEDDHYELNYKKEY